MELTIDSYKLKIGDRAPHFSLLGVDGKIHSLKEYADFGVDAIAIIFTCNHCPYARAYEERIIALQKEFVEKKVIFLAINSNDSINYPQDSFDNMKIRAKEKHFTFPYLHDAHQETAKAYGAMVTPEIFLFDSELRLVYHGHVDDNMDNPKTAHPAFKNAIASLICGEGVQVKETSAFGCSIKWK